MTFKQAALKLLSCGLRTREDEDRIEVAEAIAWAIWALMEQARYENVDITDAGDTCSHCQGEYNECDPQKKERDEDTFRVGDHVEYCGNDHLSWPEWYPSFGVIGVVRNVCVESLQVQWPAGSTSRDDLWSVSKRDVKFVEIP